MNLSRLSSLVSFILHIISIAVVIFLVFQVGSWYLNHRPILGVDFFNTVTHTKYLRDNFELLPQNFKYFWHAGVASFEDPYFLLYNITGAIAKFLPLVDTVKITMVGGLVLFAVFVYLASYQMSRNHFLSILLAVLVSYSANIYGSLTWGGSLPYFSTQLFYPASLWLLAKYLDTNNRKWFWLGSFVVGLSALGHLALAGAFILPGSAIVLMFGRRLVKASIKEKLRDISLLFFIAYLVGLRMTLNTVGGMIRAVFSGGIPFFISSGSGSAANINIGSGGVTVSGNADIIGFERSQVNILFTDTHPWLFYLLIVGIVIFVISFVLDNNKKNAAGIFAWILLPLYSAWYVFANAYGFHMLFHGWYRAFWHFPLTLALLIASLFGYAYGVLASRVKRSELAFFLIVGLASSLFTFVLFVSNDVKNVISILETKASPSSAHPEAINLLRNQTELDKLKFKLIPSWIAPDNKNFRLLTSDAQVNIWWNSVFNMPLVRGYLDSPVGSGRAGNEFLLDQSIGGDDLVKNYKYPVEVAKNMALYYIDWFSIAYAEGGHLSKSANKSPSTYLSDAIDKTEEVSVNGAYILYQTTSGKPEVWEDVPQYLKYYQFKSDLVSPIVSVSNSPSLLCICDWANYESVTKVLSMNNINSQYLVTAFHEENADSLSGEELAKFDILVLSKYKYKNRDKVFDLLTEYVKKGGKVIIDTGTEVPESELGRLPELFPFTSSERDGLGKEWDLVKADNSVFEGVDVSTFSPPLYNSTEWQFSFPKSELKPNSEIWLSQAGKPLIVKRSLGSGTVIWIGMNLSYHVHAYTNVPESIFYKNILNSLVPLERREATSGSVDFKSNRQITITSGNSGRGLLLREEFWPEWKVKINGKSFTAYPSGPTFPGFTYVPYEFNQPVKAEFSFSGKTFYYLQWSAPLVVALIMIDLVAFNGLIVGKTLKKIFDKMGKRVFGWWEKEEN